MSRNVLKIIACLSMLVDHAGYILFPELDALRCIGRLAMPIFAFFIGEGCLYTKDRKKYLIRVLSLGVVCQLFYVGEYFIAGSGDPFYLNILLTFSASVIICSAFLDCYGENAVRKNGRENIILGVTVAFFGLLCFLNERGIIPLHFDYGYGGIILPVFAAVTKERKKKLAVFSVGLLLSVLSLDYADTMWTVCALCSIIPLCFYNGKAGKKNLQKAFYLFYPVHIGVLYIISFFI